MRSVFRIMHRPAQEEIPLTQKERLRLDLQLAKWELDCAYAGFDYATDPDLIDCYIFKLNAAMKRYKFLLELYHSLQNGENDQNANTSAAYAGSANSSL